jgi:hypothetical protein
MIAAVRRATAAVLMVLAVAVGACGGAAEPKRRPVPDREQVAAVVDSFRRATAVKDYGRLCRDVLAAELVTRVQRAGMTCADALRAGLQDVRDPQLQVDRIVVTGDRATADVRTSAAGEAPSSDRLTLVREHDGWRIASLGE